MEKPDTSLAAKVCVQCTMYRITTKDETIKTDRMNSVQSSLKSFTLWITLYIVTKYYIFIRKNVWDFSEIINIRFKKKQIVKIVLKQKLLEARF